MTQNEKMIIIRDIERLIDCNYWAKHGKQHRYSEKNKIVNHLIAKAVTCMNKKDKDFRMYISIDDAGGFRFDPCPVLNFVFEDITFSFHHPEDFKMDIYTRYLTKVPVYSGSKDFNNNYESIKELKSRYNEFNE